jgi:hypothetical protein
MPYATMVFSNQEAGVPRLIGDLADIEAPGEELCRHEDYQKVFYRDPEKRC